MKRAALRALSAAVAMGMNAAEVGNVPEGIVLIGVACPDPACEKDLQLAFPHPKLPDTLMSKCPGCGHDWKLSPVAEA